MNQFSMRVTLLGTLTFVISLVGALLALGLCVFMAGCGGGGTSITPLPPGQVPQVAWSVSSVEPILSPGETGSQDVTFQSDRSFQSAAVQATGAIAQFVTISPSSFANVPAGQNQTLRVTFSVPPGAPAGDHTGGLQLITEGKALNRSLTTQLHIWALFSQPDYSVHVPAGFNVLNQEDPSDVFFEKPGQSGYGLEIRKVANNSLFSLEPWIVNQWLQLPNGSSTSSLAEYERVQDSSAELEKCTVASGTTCVRLIEHDEGDSLETFIDARRKASVFVLIVGPKDKAQGAMFNNQLKEVALITSTFELR